jgi:muramoyltetrapeptide carboxypeptidase
MELRPTPLSAGDTIRFVSPASTPDRAHVDRQAKIFEIWGLKVEYGNHVLDKYGFLAGPDADRIADLNDAIRNPSARAIICTRAGKGSYRIVDQLDHLSLRAAPKFLVGFSDNTALHFALWNQCRIVSLHGGLFGGVSGELLENTRETLRCALMDEKPIGVAARKQEPTSVLTTTGNAEGRLLGGNLDIMGTSAGWLLPDLTGAILLIEAIEMGPGLTDRMLQMLQRGGHLREVRGVAVGQFEKCNVTPPTGVLDLLREHLGELGVPILGGLCPSVMDMPP